jgi:HAD superfamily hydrolase (TIGR01484 family)
MANIPTHYGAELEALPATYAAALRADVTALKSAIAGASESSVIGVGTGGSYTVASLLCNLHEMYTGRVSRPATPLEIICNPTLAAASPVFLVSAEGKNPDIVEALRRVRGHSSRAIHILTNRPATALTECARDSMNVTTHLYELTHKDGYLATNSLLLDAVVVARAYGELNEGTHNSLPPAMDDLRIGPYRIEEWVLGAGAFCAAAALQGSLIVTHSPLLRPIAADLESKLAEAALLHCQVADLRSLSHGRHLWFAERPDDALLLALIEPSLAGLWEATQALLPPQAQTLAMPLAGSTPEHLLAGLIAEMHLVRSIGECMNRDPGKPTVPPFGRSLYYLDLPAVIRSPAELPAGGEDSKALALGAGWPFVGHRGAMRRAREAFQAEVEAQTFRAIVFDYDGTLCASRRDDGGLPSRILSHLTQLLDAKVVVGVASGRGGSIQEHLRTCIPPMYWKDMWLALYSGGWIGRLSDDIPARSDTVEFLSHVTRIVRQLQALGVPIETIRPTHPFQVSVRFREGLQTESLWFVLADALREAGLDVSRMVRSRHSIDILAAGVDKARLIADIISESRVEPREVLTVGDQGAWPGNDCSLLEHKRFSLSVDAPSRRMDRGWKLAPAHKRDVDATLWYLDRLRLSPGGRFGFTFNATPTGPAE